MKKSYLKYPQIEFGRRMRRIAWLMTALLCLLACLAGCKTQYVAMPENHNLYHHASDLRVDSVRIERFHSVIPLPTDTLNPSPFKGGGGSVLIHDSIDRWHYRLINTTDTVLQTDSIPYPVEVPKYIRQRNWYDRATSYGFWLLLSAILLFLLARFFVRR